MERAAERQSLEGRAAWRRWHGEETLLKHLAGILRNPCHQEVERLVALGSIRSFSLGPAVSPAPKTGHPGDDMKPVNAADEPVPTQGKNDGVGT